MLDDSSLPPDTAALLRELADRSDLGGFTLIGGTALALRHGHRMSEDIDFAWPSGSLPRGRIDALMRDLSHRHAVIDAMPQIDRDEFEVSGLELADHHQDWSVGGVKMTFFAPDGPEAELIGAARPDTLGNLAVADDDLLFALKSRVLYKRVASRDLFDVWHFVDRLGRSVGEVLGQLRDANPHVGADALLGRLTPARFPSTDPGFDTALPGAPKDRAQLVERMRDLVTDHQRALARNVALQALQGRGR